MMKAWYAIFLGVCLAGITKINSQTLENTYFVGGKEYRVYNDASGITWDDALSFCRGVSVNGDLGVFENEVDYADMINNYLWVDYGSGENFFHGVMKEAGSIMLRTVERRIVPFSNFFFARQSPLTEPRSCLYMQLQDTDDPANGFYPAQYGNSFWGSIDCDTTTIPRFICQANLRDSICSAPEDSCTGGGYTRDIDDFCFWNPFPMALLSRGDSEKYCMRGGGTIFNVYHINELNFLRNNGYFDAADDQFWNRFWTGAVQRPGDGAPRWKNGYVIESSVDTIWEDITSYGSSLATVGYSMIYTPSDNTWDLFRISPYTTSRERLARMAFTLCEATEDDFCLANSPKVGHAVKSIVNDQVVYTCDPDYKFPDGDTVKTYPCSCSQSSLENIPVYSRCILKNICVDDNPCEHFCTFTNEHYASYYCTCQMGYTLGAGGRCNDINECEEGTHSCPSSPYAICLNEPGSYSCGCKKGYGWDNYGNCVAFGAEYSSRVIMVVSFDKIFDVAYLDRTSSQYNDLADALTILVSNVYGNTVTISDITIREGSVKAKITLNILQVASLTDQSHIAFRFAQHVQAIGGINVGGIRCEFIGDVYYENPVTGTQIAIHTLCSLLDATNYCHGSYCSVDKEEPFCNCHEGYYGKYCDQRKDQDDLTYLDIGLLVGLCILFLLIICLFCWICCLQACIRSGNRVHHEDGGGVQVITAKPQTGYNPYGFVPSRGPRFRLN